MPPEDTASLFYPDSISWQENGGQLLVVKQYSVPYGTTVADLTESTMQWNGVDYTLWGVTQSVEGGVTEEKEVTQDFELSVRSADAETARNDVKESVAYDDEYGFSGTLTLQDITIGETLQADSTYMATAHYAGTVTRTGRYAAEVLSNGFESRPAADGSWTLPGVVSRKKQFIPAMMSAYQEL